MQKEKFLSTVHNVDCAHVCCLFYLTPKKFKVTASLQCKQRKESPTWNPFSNSPSLTHESHSLIPRIKSNCASLFLSLSLSNVTGNMLKNIWILFFFLTFQLLTRIYCRRSIHHSSFMSSSSSCAIFCWSEALGLAYFKSNSPKKKRKKTNRVSQPAVSPFFLLRAEKRGEFLRSLWHQDTPLSQTFSAFEMVGNGHQRREKVA